MLYSNNRIGVLKPKCNYTTIVFTSEVIMPFEKGHKKVGGRKKGTPDKTTQIAREAIATFVDKNTLRLERLLDKIETGVPVIDEEGNIERYAIEPDPKGAFDAITKVMEYHLPKIARVEHTGKDGAEDIKHDMQVTFVTSPKDD